MFADKKETLFSFFNVFISISVIFGFTFIAPIYWDYLSYYILGIIGISIFVIIFSIKDYLKNELKARNDPRLIIETDLPEKDDDPDLYGIGYKIEKVRTNWLEIESILEDEEFEEEVFKELEDKLSEFFIDDEVEEDLTTFIPVGERGEKALKFHRSFRKDNVRYDNIPIEFFGKSHLAYYFDKKALWVFVRNRLNKKKFIECSKSQLDWLEKELKDKTGNNYDLKRIQYYIKNSFNKFSRKELKWLRNTQNIKSFEDLIHKNSPELEKDFNKTFKGKYPYKTTDWIELQVIIKEIEAEVIERNSEFFIELDEHKYYKWFKLRQSSIFHAYWRSYVSHIHFEKDLFYKLSDPTIEETKKKIDAKGITYRQAFYIHPTPTFDMCIKREPANIMYNGWNIKCTDIAKIGIMYQKMLVNGIPIFWVNKCDYLDNKFQDQIKISQEEIMATVLKCAVHIINEAQARFEELELIILSHETSISKLRDVVSFHKASNYAFMDATKTQRDIDEELARLKAEVIHQQIKKFKGLIIFLISLVSLVFFIIGVFVGIFYGVF